MLFGYKVLWRDWPVSSQQGYRVSNKTSQVIALKHVIKKTESDDRFLRQFTKRIRRQPEISPPRVLPRLIEWKVPRRFFSNKIDEAALVMEWIDGQPLDQSVPSDLAER